MPSLSFSRELRLLTPEQFKNLFDNPVRVGSKNFTFLAKYNQQDHPRLGLAIAKKRIKLATGRNQVKRLLRESFRLNQHQLPHMDIVVFAKSGLDPKQKEALASEIAYLWRKLSRKCKQS